MICPLCPICLETGRQRACIEERCAWYSRAARACGVLGRPRPPEISVASDSAAGELIDLAQADNLTPAQRETVFYAAIHIFWRDSLVKADDERKSKDSFSKNGTVLHLL